MLRLHNTLSRQAEALAPLEPGRVSMYVCGITVYDRCHLGHGRFFVVFDVLYRHLRAHGFDVTYVRNITDVDDKIIRRAAESGESIDALTSRSIREMQEDAAALGTLAPTHEPRATESIDAMLELIARLVDAGSAYAGDNGDVYFSVGSFAGYGKLSGRRLADMRAGERVAIDEHKRDPLDFVLWKAAREGEPAWPSPWGPGRPGWHIECSAMALSLLGERFDIHGGGMDLVFPHHENEIAQTESCTGSTMASLWVHNGLVRLDDEKMSKSIGNVLSVRELLAHWSGEELRLFVLSTHYRSPLNFSETALRQARAALARLYTALRDAPPPGDPEPAVGLMAVLDTAAVERFEAAMDDDLSTPEALAVLFELAGNVHRHLAGSPSDARRAAATLRMLGGRLGLLQSDPDAALQTWGSAETGLDVDAIEAALARREAARAARDFATADAVRDELLKAGIAIEDGADGTRWRRT